MKNIQNGNIKEMVAQNIDKGKYPDAIYSEYAPQIITSLNLKKTTAKEHHGACPNCGGVDRFWISEYQGLVKVNCRQCGDWKTIISILRDMKIYPDKIEGETVVNFPEQQEIHPYLTRKRINQHNAEIDEGDLVIPIIDKTGKRQGSQFIDKDGTKKFNFGLQYKGCFSVLNAPIKDLVYLCEGFATAASVAQALDNKTSVVHALNASNILNVIEVLKEVRPEAKIIIAGDNDEAGRKVCERAFAEYGVESVLPQTESYDWNDVWIARGAEFTRKALKPRNVLDEVIFPDQARPQLDNKYIAKGWLAENSISVVYGPSNVGKSFFCMSLAYHIAAGREWMGNRINKGSVLYLATEGGAAFQNRLVALREKYPDYENVNLAVRPSPINLYDAEEDIAKVEAIIKEISEKRGQVSMMVIDTLSRATALGNMDENDNSSMSKLIAGLDLIRERTGIHIMLVHHSGKDTSRGARGASSLKAACDTEIELSFDEETRIRTAKATKQRDIETGAEINFILQVIELGEDADGDQVTTCVIREATQDEMEEKKRSAITGKNQKIFKEVFYQLRGEKTGGPNPSGAGWPTGGKYWCIDEEKIKEHFLGKVAGAANPHSTYKQAFDGLHDNGHIAINLGKIWFTDKNGKTKDGL